MTTYCSSHLTKRSCCICNPCCVLYIDSCNLCLVLNLVSWVVLFLAVDVEVSVTAIAVSLNINRIILIVANLEVLATRL